jgi:hypothetical protein
MTCGCLLNDVGDGELVKACSMHSTHAHARIAQLERELAEARELLQEAWDYYGVLWRGNRIYNHVKTDAASKPAAPTADDATTHNQESVK